MRILVSNKEFLKPLFPDYIVVKNADEALKLRGAISLLVVDGSSVVKRREMVGLNGSKAPDKMPELVKKSELSVYVAEAEVLDNHLKLLIDGAGGIYLDKEFFLKDQKTLEGYLENFRGVDIANPEPVVGTELVSTGINSVLDSFSGVDENEPLSPQSRELLIRTVKEYSQQVELFVEERQRAAKSALEYADSNTKIFNQLVDVNNQLKSHVEEMEQMIRNGAVSAGSGSNISFFPKFQLDAARIKSHIKIKKLGNAVFCMSFVLGLKAYLVRNRNVRAQVIVLAPETKYYTEIYRNFPWITKNSNKDGSAYIADVVFVGYPTKKVLERLVNNDGYYESLIFLDMMTQDTEHLIRSRKRSWLFSSSPKLIKELGLPFSNTILTLKTHDGVAFAYKSWGMYPDKVGDRERAYIEQVGKMYSIMYEGSL